ncbi:VOC family protein [Microbacterium resistens]|uniref:VOC family protein n=1 Tax=Microbacterium resistens TaxID=156977 RepID=UPI0036719761
MLGLPPPPPPRPRPPLWVAPPARAPPSPGGARARRPPPPPDGLAWLRTGDGVEVMLHERRAEPSDTAVAAGFATVGLEDAVDRCVGAGGVVVDEVETRPWGERMAVLRDPDGHLLCVSEGR